jgi:dTMP kinase
VQNKSLLIAIEGIDASGKQSQVAALVSGTAMTDPQLNADAFAFPNYSSPTGRLIKQMLSQSPFEYSRADQALLIQSLMTVNRYELWPTIEQSLAYGDVVLDRYAASGLVYGGYDGLPADWLRNIHRPLPAPDLYVLLDIPVEESFRRRPIREDAYEADKKRLASVREGYVCLWAARPSMPAYHGGETTWLMLDGTQPQATVTAQIVRAVDALRKAKHG